MDDEVATTSRSFRSSPKNHRSLFLPPQKTIKKKQSPALPATTPETDEAPRGPHTGRGEAPVRCAEVPGAQPTLPALGQGGSRFKDGDVLL